MTVPTSKLLKANKSLIATASLKHMSPSYENSQQQSVSIVVNNSTPDLLKATTEESEDKNNVNQTEDTNDVCSLRGTKVVYDDNPYAGITRDLQSAEINVNDLSKLVTEKENIIKAQSLIIDMFQHNPLIINKYIIATEEVLIELIKLLTSASTVEIELADIECTCTQPKFAVIKKIFLTVSGEIYSIELCPAVLKLFESYKISLSFVAL